jgi:ubiquinone/menaquinone biosynthesis C-methylase UbiE
VARLAREMPSVRTVGCDFSTGMLAHAAARTPHGRFVRGDACRLPFADGAFDAVVSTEAFHWFPDQAAALREFRRVLAPGGRLMLAVVSPRLAVAGAVARLGSWVAGEPFVWPTASAMRVQLRAAGFRLLSQRHVFRLPGLLLFPPVLTVAAPAPALSGRRPPRSSAPPLREAARATR